MHPIIPVDHMVVGGYALLMIGIAGEYESFFHSFVQGSESRCPLSNAAHSMQLAEAVQNCYSGTLPLAAIL